MPAATNALKYQQGYIQSNTERYAKFRDEAYKELMDEYGNDLAARKLLQDREKELLQAIAKEKELGLKGGKSGEYVELLTLKGKLSADLANQGEDASKRRIQIQQGKKGEFNVPTATANKISDFNTYLQSNAHLLTTPQATEAAILKGIDEVAQTWTAGQRSALGAGQQLYNVIASSSVFNNLSPAQRAAVVSRVADRAGLATLNVADISGPDLLGAPLDQLILMETEDELKSYGAAFTRDTQQTLNQVNALIDAYQKKAAEEGKKPEDVKVDPNADELVKVRAKLAEAKAEKPTEAQVRALAREKFQPEASDFLRQQFERDRYANDADQSKLIHYDAIQTAKKMKLKEDSDAYKKAKMLIDAENKTASPSDIRNAALRAAVDYAGGDIKKRDQFLENYHAIKMQAEQAKYAPQRPVEPVRADIVGAEPSPSGRLSGTPGPRGIVPTNEQGYAVDESGNVREPRLYVPPLLRERASPGFLLDRISGGINRLAMSEDVQSPTILGQEYGDKISPEEQAQIIEAEKLKQRQNLARRIVGIGNTFEPGTIEDLFKQDL